jgi:exodeoxyribonuclease X
MLPATSAILLDTETTGIGKQAQALEVGSISLDPIASYPLLPFYANNFTTYCQRFQVTEAIHPEAQKVHGISKVDLLGCDATLQFQLPQIEYLLAYNAKFDTAILENCSPAHAGRFADGSIKVICLFVIAKKLWTKEEVGQYKLTNLIEQLVPEGHLITSEAHGALPDCKLSLILLGLILEKLPRVTSWEELYEYQGGAAAGKKKAVSTTYEVMPFGKHKGEMFCDIPKSYLIWLSKQDLQEKLARTIKEWL